MLPEQLHKKIQTRVEEKSLRTLKPQSLADVDFSSNDYLGFANNQVIAKGAAVMLGSCSLAHGSTGSRLLSGNTPLHEQAEGELPVFYDAPAGLLFNSGYDANLGLFSSVPQKGDVVLYDEYIHASVRDGIRLSFAKPYKFKHNSIQDLEAIYTKVSKNFNEVYIAVESVYSMDGDSPNLKDFVDFSKANNCKLIVDEAHGVGVFGEKGQGLLHQLQLHNQVFARVSTFGKALGCHGAMVLGSEALKQYLLNFARSLIYTTAMPGHSVAVILAAHQELLTTSEITKLRSNVAYFRSLLQELNLETSFVDSHSAIQTCIIPGNKKVQEVAEKFYSLGMAVSAVRSPTVPQGQERLRICLHSGQTEKEMEDLLKALQCQFSSRERHTGSE